MLHCYTTTFPIMHELILIYYKHTHLFSNIVYHGYTLLRLHVHVLSNTPLLVSAHMLNAHIVQLTYSILILLLVNWERQKISGKCSLQTNLRHDLEVVLAVTPI